MEREKILIDTNIFVEFLLKQERAIESLNLMVMVEEKKFEAFVTGFSLHTIEVILDRNKKHVLLEQFLKRVTNAQALTVYQTTLQEEREIALLAPQVGLDFDDGLQYFVTKAVGASFVSFDHDFDKTDLKRIEPDALMQNHGESQSFS
jgi:uncharacterized protein